jgi:hypothetical protein
MKKKSIVIIIIASIVILVIAIILLSKNEIIKEKSKIKIIDATYACEQSLEYFYEDDKYTYSFPCIKSKSVFVKFPNGNKMVINSMKSHLGL